LKGIYLAASTSAAKLCLDQKKRKLDLERKIARAQAEEQTYAKAKLEDASIKRPSRIPAQVLPPLLDEGSHPMAPQETKPSENTYNEDNPLCWSQYKINFIIKWLICQGEIPSRTNRDPQKAAES